MFLATYNALLLISVCLIASVYGKVKTCHKCYTENDCKKNQPIMQCQTELLAVIFGGAAAAAPAAPAGAPAPGAPPVAGATTQATRGGPEAKPGAKPGAKPDAAKAPADAAKEKDKKPPADAAKKPDAGLLQSGTTAVAPAAAAAAATNAPAAATAGPTGVPPEVVKLAQVIDLPNIAEFKDKTKVIGCFGISFTQDKTANASEIRGCGPETVGGAKFCDFIKKKYDTDGKAGKVSKCYFCKSKDNCSGAISHLHSQTAAFYSVVAAIVLFSLFN